MEMYILIGSLLLSIIGAIVSWHYSIKSKKHADQALSIMKKQYDLERGSTLNAYIDEACNVFIVKGSPFNYVDSLPIDISEKEEVWAKCFQRYKKRPPENSFSKEKEERNPQ